MELKIKVICENLPSQPLVESVNGQPAAREQIHIGIQRGDEVVEVVPVDAKGIVFEPSFVVSRLPNGKTNFLGPYAKGTPAQRFFYLSWVVQDQAGNLNRLGRVKIQLSHISWAQVEQAVGSGRGLTVAVSLTDKRGKPRGGTIQGDDVRWE